MSDKSKETVLDKIKKLLTLAKRSDNISEAESAMKMAQRIALKSGIDLNDVEAKEEHERRVIRWVVPQDTKTAPFWRIRLASTIADNFRCRAYKLVGYEDSQIEVMGLESDIEVFKVMFDYAETCLEVFFKRYLKEEKQKRKFTRHDSLVLRNSYVDGFLNGIKLAFEQNVQCYALSLCLPVEVSTELATMEFTDIKSKSSLDEEFDPNSFRRGKEDGKEAGNRNRLED